LETFESAAKPGASKIAVVIPCYCVEKHIQDVIAKIPACVDLVIAVDDASPDRTPGILDDLPQTHGRLVVVHHPQNKGVGGAMITGYREALRRDAAIVVKLDGDDQMDAALIPLFVTPLLQGRAEYVKGNRFHQFSNAATMPFVRRMGNLGLSFLIKAASGYWNILDPTNGYTASSAAALSHLDLDAVEERYLFETSMLVQLYAINARVTEIPMFARYAGETSSLSVTRSLFEFPPYLLRAFLKRVFRTYFWNDFTATSVFLLMGVLLSLFGTGYGLYFWIRSEITRQAATAGTVMVAALTVILGFQLLLQAWVLDIQRTPRVSEWWSVPVEPQARASRDLG